MTNEKIARIIRDSMAELKRRHGKSSIKLTDESGSLLDYVISYFTDAKNDIIRTIPKIKDPMSIVDSQVESMYSDLRQNCLLNPFCSIIFMIGEDETGDETDSIIEMFPMMDVHQVFIRKLYREIIDTTLRDKFLFHTHDRFETKPLSFIFTAIEEWNNINDKFDHQLAYEELIQLTKAALYHDNFDPNVIEGLIDDVERFESKYPKIAERFPPRFLMFFLTIGHERGLQTRVDRFTHEVLKEEPNISCARFIRKYSYEFRPELNAAGIAHSKRSFLEVFTDN